MQPKYLFHTYTYLFVLNVGLLMLFMSACSSSVAIPDIQSDATRQQQQVDGLTITLDSAPVTPRVNRYQSFQVFLTDTWGRLVEAEDVYLDLKCAALCAVNRPIAEPTEAGAYLASSTYTMPGEWTVTVVATVQDQEYRATFLTHATD